jgi:hypothetical protein
LGAAYPALDGGRLDEQVHAPRQRGGAAVSHRVEGQQRCARRRQVGLVDSARAEQVAAAGGQGSQRVDGSSDPHEIAESNGPGDQALGHSAGQKLVARGQALTA